MRGHHGHGVELEILEHHFRVALLYEWRDAWLYREGDAALLQVVQQLILVANIFRHCSLAQHVLDDVAPDERLQIAVVQQAANLRVHDLLVAGIKATFLDVRKCAISQN